MKKYLLLFATMVTLIFTMCITVNAATVEGSANTGWSYDESTSTLTLTNYNSTDVISVGTETCQIYSDGDLNIVLEGTNTLNLTSTYGIYVEGNLTISGSGTLNIANATNGIYATKNITVTSGTISASSMQARGGGITVDNGKIDLTGSVIASDGQITINKGNIKSTTITAKNIIINNGLVDSKLTATLKIEVNDGELNSTNVRISNNDGVFNVTGGKVTINGEVNLSCDASFSGGDINVTDAGGMYVYLGLYVKGGNINVVGGIDGTLDMTGGTLYVEGNIGDVMDSNISGGALTVKGEIYSGWSTIRISGGMVTVESDGYGLRTADEDIIISGGEVFVTGQTQALKAGGQIRIGGVFETGENSKRASYAESYYSEKYIHISYNGNIDTTPKVFPAIITINNETIEEDFSGNGFTYEAATSTITLKDINLIKSTEIDGKNYLIHSNGNLNIVLEGTNTLNAISDFGIYVEGNLSVGGTGILNVPISTSGLYATKNITINSGTINTSSIQARGGDISVASGNITVAGNIIASDGTVTISNGNVTSTLISTKNTIINNGVVASKLSSTLKIEVNNGELNSTNVRISNNDGVFNITGGKVTINGEVNLSSDASFSGGEINITDAGGMYVYLGLYVKGGNINIIGGIDGTLDMTGGTLYVEGNIGDVMDSNISGGTLTVKGEIYSGWSTIRIRGGTINIESTGYGLRTADEDIIISGGTISIFGQTQALKAGGEIRWSGNCISFLTGSSASNAKVETQYYGEKYVGTIESHSWNSGSITTNPTHLTEGTRTYTCSKCSSKKYESISKTTAHEFGNWNYVDTTNHKRECPCGEIETETHTWSEATCTQKSKCSACTSERGEVDVDNHTSSNIIYAINPLDLNSHDKKHECCGAIIETAAHSGGTATCKEKAKCDICKHTYGAFAEHNFDETSWGYKSADGHAHACQTSGCSEHDTVVEHTSSGAATEDVAEICTECGYIISPALGHKKHTAKTEWTTDDKYHWHECTGCEGQQLDKSSHKDLDNNAKCDTCGATVPVGMVGEPDEDVNSDGDGLSGGAIAGIAVGSTAVVGVGGFSLIWFVIKKKSWADLLAVFKK